MAAALWTSLFLGQTQEANRSIATPSPPAYVPMNAHQRLMTYLKETVSPVSLLRSAEPAPSCTKTIAISAWPRATKRRACATRWRVRLWAVTTMARATSPLSGSNARWKICFFHHPLYSDGRMHGPDLDLRKQLEPIFALYGVNVVLAGHEHFYERVKPQQGIYYFVLGSSGQLRTHNVKSSRDVAKSFDTDQAFTLMEIDGDELHFQTISRTGATVDAGMLPLQSKSN